MKKWIAIILFIIVFFIGLAVLLFYTPDIPLEILKENYSIQESRLITVQWEMADGTELEIDLHYLDFGDEKHPTIVLLHGMFSSAFTFVPWANRLVEQGYRVLAIDLPYHGLSGGFLDQKTSIRRSAYAVHALLKQLNVTNFVIGGNSMGGGVSWYYTSEFHQTDGVDVLGLVLIDSVFEGSGSQRQTIEPEWLARFVSQMTPKFLLRTLLEGAYGNQSVLRNDVLNRYSDLIRKEGYRYGLLTLIQEDSWIEVDAVSRMDLIRSHQIPVLLMWGKEDSWVPIDVGVALQNALDVPEQRFIIYETLGHVPMEENPELTIIDLIDFLNPIMIKE